MNGATGIELAEEAYTLHKTQASSGMSVTETGTKYDNRVFGLAFTTVGEDVRKDDFLENIYDAPGSYDAAANNVEATPAPTEVPAYMAHMPALNAKGFLDEGEYLYSSEDEGLWIYVSQTSKVIIQRKYDATQPLTWFEADLYGDLDAGEMLRTVQNDPEKMAKCAWTRQKPQRSTTSFCDEHGLLHLPRRRKQQPPHGHCHPRRAHSL